MAAPELVAPELVTLVRARLAQSAAPVTPHTVAEALRACGRPVGDATVLAVHDALRAESVGLGPLEALVSTPGVTDVLVNGSAGVWVDRGEGLVRADVEIGDEAAVRRFAQRLAAAGGRRLDDASPAVDVRLPDGIRCHAVLAPIARPGTLISLRVPHRLGLSLDDLRARGALTPEGLTLVRGLLAARVAFLVTGGTGSGKTTVLAAMLEAVAPGERLVVVEDAAELDLQHPHVVALEARPANLEGVGSVPLQMLVRQALRMRPDRLVVGEVRGAEVVDLLAALNTGHEGGCGTLHANSAADVLARIESLALAAGLGREAVHSQVASAVGAVLHLTRLPRRRLAEIGLPVRDAAGLVRIETAVRFEADGSMVEGPAAGQLAEQLG